MSTTLRTSSVHARIAPKLKKDAEALLDKLGILPSQAITLFYNQVVLRRALPFEVSLPKETAEEFAAVRGGKTKRFPDADALFRDLKA